MKNWQKNLQKGWGNLANKKSGNKKSGSKKSLMSFMKSSVGDDPHWRHNYEDHSLRFLDWVEKIGIEKTWFGKLFTALEEKFRIRSLLFIVVFAFVLSYALFLEVDIPYNIKLGEIARISINSPISFEMQDEVATESLRLQAEQEIPPVFNYNPKIFNQVSQRIYQAFRGMRSLYRTVAWPKDPIKLEEMRKEFLVNKPHFERDLGSEVPDYLFEWLTAQAFSVRVENIIIHSLDQWYINKIYDSQQVEIPSTIKQITLVLQENGFKPREMFVDKESVYDLRDSLFAQMDNKGLEGFSTRDKQHIVDFAQTLFKPNLTLNIDLTEYRKMQARGKVLPVTRNIKKNDLIVSAGTRVEPYHIALVKEMLREKKDIHKSWLSVVSGFLFVAMILVFLAYLRRFTVNKVKLEMKDLVVMALINLGVVLMTKLYIFITDAAFVTKFGYYFSSTFFMYAAPVAAGPMLVGLVITSGEVVWLFTAFTSIVLGIMMDMDFTFMVVSFAGGIAAARAVQGCKKRNDIYLAGIKVGIVNAVVIGAIMTMKTIEHENFYRQVLLSMPAGFLSGLFSSLVTMVVVPIIESVFNYTTDVKLLELSNLNHPLLKEMIVKSPGTYHHSMMVGSMVEAAAEEIGANPLLGKVMSYYHDIGKMEHSNYFIENQRQGHNPHDHISPFMSKTLLIAHVKDGVELGMEYKLGKPIIDGIIQHHGTTMISYFYNKAADIKNEGDPEIGEEDFRYPGPRPQFREAALCMLADSIEAAARSLDEPTPVRLQNIVKNIIQRKFMDGQLDECNLTLKDLSKVEAAFIRILLGIYHQRIDYPKSAGGGASETPTKIGLAKTGKSS